MFLLQAILLYSLCWMVLKTILRFSDSLGALTGFTKYLYSWLIFITVKKKLQRKISKGESCMGQPRGKQAQASMGPLPVEKHR